MAIGEKILGLIGLEPITNREQLLDELAELSAEELEKLLAKGDLYDRLGDIKCEECKEDHGGECPCSDEDDDCPSLAEWLDRPCVRERLLPEEGETA